MKQSKLTSVPSIRIVLHAMGLLRNPIKEITLMSKKYGDIFEFGNINTFAKQSSKPAIFVHYPDYVKHILKDNQANYSRGIVFKKRKDLACIDSFLGNGIFMSDGAVWEEQHKMLRILFSGESLEKTHVVIQSETDQLIFEWNEKITISNKIDIETSVHFRMLRILFKSFLITAEDFNYLEIFDTFQNIMKAASFKESVNNFIKIGLLRAIGIKRKPIEYEIHVEKLNLLVKQLIERLQNNKSECGALTELLIEKFEKEEINYQEVRDTVMNFIFAGFETSAAAISWSLYCLAKHPAEQEKVANEILQSKIKNNTDLIQVNELPVLIRFIKESMRFYPPVWLYIRQSLEDDYIGDKFIPKGSLILICPFALHQHESFWKNPGLFQPENFEKENLQGKAFVYMPFGQGKRMCLGHALANIQMQIILSKLIGEFKFEKISKKEPKINPAIIIKGAKPISLKVTKR
ncbi:MAG: cytochrome P450 [Sphingobacteriia bacterium]|nr:MAG: cytochrome P450 [Sphingobacteriia bacterium]